MMMKDIFRKFGETIDKAAEKVESALSLGPQPQLQPIPVRAQRPPVRRPD